MKNGLFVCLLMASPALAQEKLPDVCSEYFNSPSGFSKIPQGADGSYRFNFGSSDHAVSLGLSDGRGVCAPIRVCKKTKKSCLNIPVENALDNIHSKRPNLELVTKNKELYAVGKLDGKAVWLASVKRNKFEYLCEYRNQLQGWQKPKQSSRICEALEKNELKLLKADKPHRLKNLPVSNSPLGDSSYVLDLNNDSLPMNIITMELLQEKDCSCTRPYLALLNSFGDDLIPESESKLVSAKQAQMSRALRELTQRDEFCGADQRWSFVEFGNKIYLLSSPQTQPGENVRGKILPRKLFSWSGQKFQELCQQEAKLELRPIPPYSSTAIYQPR